MNIDEIVQKASAFRPAIEINTIPHGIRQAGAFFCFSVAFVSLVSLVFASAPTDFLSNIDKVDYFHSLAVSHAQFLAALLLLALGTGMLGAGLNSFHTYYYLRGVRRVFGRNLPDITYEVAEVFRTAAPAFEALVTHKQSAFLISRLGLDKEYLLAHFGKLPLSVMVAPEFSEVSVTLGSLWKAMYESSPELAKYMLSQSAKKSSLYSAAYWMDRLVEAEKKAVAWWWRENLSKTRGFAKTLSYGMTGYISRYATEMILDPKLQELGDVILHQKECGELEEILAKKGGANAVLVGPNGSGRYTVTLALARAIEEGRVYSEIEHKRLFLINASSFDLMNDKVVFENALITMFNQATAAHNIIFVIDEISKIVGLCKQLGFDFWSVIDPYIEHSAVSLVVLTDEATYTQNEYRLVFEKRFEVIKMRDLSGELFMPYLEDKAMAEEKKTGKFFTLFALETIAQALPVFFVEDAPLSKANSIIEALATSVSSRAVIGDEDVQKYLQATTGVMLGKVDEGEKEDLLHLEDILARNVMGQKEAITSVAKTMRRIRSGITDGGKPMGTFLFLGPTGSGKTETAKTLAKVFFGNEEYMSRLDMGEYALSESAQRLLGDKDHEGDLARLIHTRPHGVLLLDEFEKSSADVKDLFLRILDEGVFTDGQGRTVSLRTQIIIATSNAGSELIRESRLVADYEETAFASVKQKLIDTILEQGIFKPELVNRFDATIMFLPLSKDTVKSVAGKMLDELGKRIHERGYDVVWEDDLIEYVVQHSQADEFGGRAIQRVIQDTIEDVLSKRIIEGNLQPGEMITLSKKDIPLGME